MPVKNYGVWAGIPLSYKAEHDSDDSRSPHLTIRFSDDDSNTTKQAPINVKSLSRDTRLVYWVDRTFTHPITTSLRALELGFHSITSPDDPLSLDYQRTQPPLLRFSDGLLLPHDVPGPNNDVLDQLIPTVERAIAGTDAGNKIYIFGSSYNTGIHDIHMNQGSLPRFDNGVGQDGAVVFYFADEDRFEAVFLAFASQRVPTDDDSGLAGEGSRALAEIARGGRRGGPRL